MSSCFDVNRTSSIANTLELQSLYKSKSNIINNNNSDHAKESSVNSSNSSNQTSTSSLYLSLIIASGFSRGEIHVFDAFKKDSSVFFNNNKIIDKTKVTCIKWLPKSHNLFLVGYSSGNIYLYDANNQANSTMAPAFTKIYQTEAFSLHLNNSNNNGTSTGTKNSSAVNSGKSSNISKNNNNSNSNSEPTKQRLTFQNSGINKKIIIKF
jgi:hypothetical protein